MSTENVTMAFQNAAATGVGLTQFFSEPRFTTFRITGNGSVSVGHVTIECCPQKTPMIPGASSAGSLDNVDHNPRSIECDNRMVCRERVRHVSREDQHARDGRNRHSPGDSTRRVEGLEPPPLVSLKGRRGTGWNGEERDH